MYYKAVVVHFSMCTSFKIIHGHKCEHALQLSIKSIRWYNYRSFALRSQSHDINKSYGSVNSFLECTSFFTTYPQGSSLLYKMLLKKWNESKICRTIFTFFQRANKTASRQMQVHFPQSDVKDRVIQKKTCHIHT